MAVVPTLIAGITSCLAKQGQDVDGRNKSGHDATFSVDNPGSS